MTRGIGPEAISYGMSEAQTSIEKMRRNAQKQFDALAKMLEPNIREHSSRDPKRVDVGGRIRDVVEEPLAYTDPEEVSPEYAGGVEELSQSLLGMPEDVRFITISELLGVVRQIESPSGKTEMNRKTDHHVIRDLLVKFARTAQPDTSS